MQTLSKIKYIPWLIISLLLGNLALGQIHIGLPYVENFFLPTDSLRNSYVYSIQKLPSGFTAAATNHGILIFDGDQWFDVLDGDFTALAYDTTNKLLYAGTPKDFGYITFDQALHAFKYVRLSILSPHIIKNTWKICTRQYGVFFLVNYKDVYKYDFNGLKYVDLQGFGANHCFKFGQNLLIVDDSLGMGVLSKNGFFIISTRHKSIYAKSIVGVIPLSLKKKTLLITTRNGEFYKYYAIQDSFELLFDKPQIGKYLIEDVKLLPDKNLLLQTASGGLFVINPKGKILKHFDKNNSLPTNRINAVYIDPWGIIWIGSSRFVSRIYYSVPYKFANERLGISGDIVDITVFNKKLFVTTTAGLFVADTNSSSFKTITNECVFNWPNDLQVSLNNKNYLLIGSKWQLLLLESDQRIHSLKKIYGITNLLKDSRSNIYAITSDSIFKFKLTPNLKLHKLKAYYLKYLVEQAVLISDTLLLLYSPYNNLLIAANINDSVKEPKYHHVYLSNIRSVYRMQKYHDSLLLMATDKGLAIYNPKTHDLDLQKFQRLNILSYSHRIRDMLIEDTCAWFVTDESIIFYSLDKSYIKIFPIQTKTTSHVKRIVKWDKTLVGHKTFELFFVPQDQLLQGSNKLNEIPLLSYIQIDNKPYFWLGYNSLLQKTDDSTWVFRSQIPERKNIIIKLSFISSYPAKSFYSYKYDNNAWSDWSENSKIVLPYLHAGKHQIVIRIRSDITNKIYYLRLNLDIKSAFFRSIWLKLIIGAIILTFLLLIVTRITSKERRRRLLLEHLVRRRTKELEIKNKLLEEQYQKLNEMTDLLVQQKEELEAQNERLRLTNLELRQLSLVAQKTNNSVLILDKKGRIEWWNEGFTKLFSYKFKLDKQAIPSLIKNIRPDVFERIKNFKPTQESIEYTTREVLPDGKTERWYKTTITPVYDEQGEIYRFVVLDVDITEIKMAEKQIKQQKDELEKQTAKLKRINAQIEEHRLKLEIQHKEMLSSLEYAKKIQNALLPNETFQLIFPEYFILYLPKEIVSGDFYYITKKNSKIIIAVADGTGHGVPGAFMSVLGLTLLKDAIEKNEQNLQPALVLNSLREAIIKALHQFSYETHVKDGLDIALAIIDVPEKMLYFSGANIPLTLVRDGQILIEIRSDRMPIGIHEFANVPFKQEHIPLKDKDRIYLYTDGYVDQFGGPENKRFKRTRLKKLLLNIQDQAMYEQKITLLHELEVWMNGNDQIDDITLLGIEVNLQHLQKISSTSDL